MEYFDNISTVDAASSSTSTETSNSRPFKGWDDVRLCRVALTANHGRWETSTSFLQYVEEAKHRGLSITACRTKMDAATSSSDNQAATGGSPESTSGELQTIEEKLRNLQSLLSDGLITEEEAAITRQKILDDM